MSKINPNKNKPYLQAAKLKAAYETAANNYLKAFCIKHDYDYDNDFNQMWVGKDIGGVAEIGDLYVGLDDIRTDINCNAPVDEFIKWYDYSMRLGVLGATYPNYQNWLYKCPIKTEEEILKMESLRRKISDIEDELKIMINS